MIIIETFKNICRLSESRLITVLQNFLNTKYDKVIGTKDYIIATGDIPIALTAHADTVFPETKKSIYYDSDKCVFWSPDGLGADDRAGIYAIIKIIESGLRPTIIITTGEEAGCQGARQLVKDYPKTPDMALKYIIELDRHGNNDCVFYDCYNKKFKDYIRTFGFIENKGIYSDISVICPIWDVAGVNLSIGYYDEHSYTERLNFNELWRTIEIVKMMLQDHNKSSYFTYEASGNKCAICNLREGEYIVHIAKGETQRICLECVLTDSGVELDWCEKCGSAFVKPNQCGCEVNLNGKA